MRSRRVRFGPVAASLAALASSPVWADCPVSMADTAAGVYVAFDDTVVRYDRSPDGRMEELEFGFEDAPGLVYTSLHGIWLLSSVDLIGGFAQEETREEFSYDRPLPPTVTPNSEFQVTSTVRPADGDAFTEALSLRTGPVGTTQIGTCTLDVIEARLDIVTGNERSTSIFQYFPALGFAVFVGFEEPGQQPESYPATRISTRPFAVGSSASGNTSGSSTIQK